MMKIRAESKTFEEIVSGNDFVLVSEKISGQIESTFARF
jgi:hypothetical protein